MGDNNRPIGVFDSGVGGLTVLNELLKQLPNESFIYLGDSARVPYGAKSEQTIQRYANQICDFLIHEHNVKYIVVACNTATAFSLEYLRSTYRVPIVGVVEPGVRRALSISKNNVIGVLGTEGTIRSKIYEKTMDDLGASIESVSIPTPLLVPLVEEQVLDSNVLQSVFDFYFKSYKPYSFDTLILGCTHYPLLKSFLQSYFGREIQIVDSAEATAEAVRIALSEANFNVELTGDGSCDVYFTDLSRRVESISRHVLEKRDIGPLKRVELD